jgi:LysM repeat protein
MKKYLLVVFILAVQFSFSQEKKSLENVSLDSNQKEYIYHEVKFGETVALLYKKYLVNPKEIYKANEGISDGIVAGTVLKIPVTNDYRKKQGNQLIANNKEIIAYK